MYLFLGGGGDTIQFMTSFLVVGHQKINGGLNLASWLPCWSLAYLLGAEFLRVGFSSPSLGEMANLVNSGYLRSSHQFHL